MTWRHSFREERIAVRVIDGEGIFARALYNAIFNRGCTRRDFGGGASFLILTYTIG
jgi:hypothetical protein